MSANAEPAAVGTFRELARVSSLTSRKVATAESSSPSLQEAPIVLGLGGIPGSDSAGEGLAIRSDVSVLVDTQAARIAELRRTLSVLEQYGVAPVWAVMAPPVQARQSTEAPTGPRAVTSAPPRVDTPQHPGLQAPTRPVLHTLGVEGSQKSCRSPMPTRPGVRQAGRSRRTQTGQGRGVEAPARRRWIDSRTVSAASTNQSDTTNASRRAGFMRGSRGRRRSHVPFAPTSARGQPDRAC